MIWQFHNFFNSFILYLFTLDILIFLNYLINKFEKFMTKDDKFVNIVIPQLIKVREFVYFVFIRILDILFFGFLN